GDRRTKTQDKSVAELWQKLEELQAEAQRERGEKEELRKSNEKLQLRLDALSKQIGVQPIKAPSPPKSLTSSFRQVASDRRDGSETAPTPLTALASHVSEVQRRLPVAFQPQVRQSLPSQPYRQPSRVEISRSPLAIAVKEPLTSFAAAPSAGPTRSRSLGPPTSND
ncbi:unnamed protein product, partial [Polarella glacialis]